MTKRDGTSRRSGMVAYAMPMTQKIERVMRGARRVCNRSYGDGYVPLRQGCAPVRLGSPADCLVECLAGWAAWPLRR